MPLPESVLAKLSPEARAKLGGTPTPAHAPAPAPAPVPALDFDSKDALDAGGRGPARIPWDLEVVLKADLLRVKHVQGRNCPRYEFIFEVLESNRADISVGSTRVLQVHYEPNPRTDNEKFALQSKLGEIRGLMAALAGRDVRDVEFKANDLLAELLAVSEAEADIHLQFRLEQTGRINKMGKQTYDKHFKPAS